MLKTSLVILTGLIAVGASAALPETVTIRTLAAQMRYDTSDVIIRPGAQVKIVFENSDDLPHNIVFFQPGTDVVAVSNKQMEKPEEALKRDWLPDDPRIWLHSKLVNPKQKDELTFTAPDKPGIYPYVCTFPGHALTMQGRLKVLAPGPGLSDLKFQVYLGDWKKLPDFKSLVPHREGDLPGNLVELKFDDYRNQFGVVYSGKLNAPTDGDYTFSVAGDDGVRVLVDDKKVVESDGIHPSSEIRDGKVKLSAGTHNYRLEYFQAAGEAEIYAAWRGPAFTNTTLSKWVHPQAAEGSKIPKKDDSVGMPLVVGTEPVIYRNFISGAGNRGIAVGYPGGFNIAWSADQLNLALVWRGAFIDAARHWIDRGGGHQAPLGYDVFKPSTESALPFAVLASPDAEWPKLEKDQRAAGYKWHGYRLDEKRFPTFSYEWNGVNVTERFDVEGNAVTGNGRLVRTLKLSGKLPGNATFRVATGNAIQPVGNSFVVDGKFAVAVEGAALAGKNLLVPVRPEIKLIYSWPETLPQHASTN
ncbi:MAG: hypothetical protein JWL59_1409 [Chthoniobacteraceae bacterium]|nr:hypothetical protein [Chthoniobacteraceae bacterium]